MMFLTWSIGAYIIVRIISDSLVKHERDPNSGLDK